MRTAIWKRPVTERVLAGRLNLAGGAQAGLLGHGGEQRAIMVYQFDSYGNGEQKLGDRTSCSAKTLTAKCASATVSHRRRHLRNNPTTRYLLRGRPATRLINAGRAPQLVQRCLAMPRNPSSLIQWPGDTRTRGSAIYLCSKYHEPSQSAGGGSCFRQLMRFANIIDG